jgi:2-polyprenyl-3-methyl-5-hydroxy-6-metoxy-1,4-benzoquinol methylase
MNSINIHNLDSTWPEDCLETVTHCPYCGSTIRVLAHKDVQDWAFHCAPGKWAYWECSDCNTLYLDPRPTINSIGAAYDVYYTHKKTIKDRLVIGIKQRLRNLCFYAWYNLDLKPRFNMNHFIFPLLSVFKDSIAEPFIPMCLNDLPKGKLLDVGCGSGELLGIAKQLGWDVRGIEIDPKAVITALSAGHKVTEGAYDLLEQYIDEFDCVVCSHVLEHIHEPIEFIKLLAQVLKRGGSLLLAVPNSRSITRTIMKENWRGLEAPRHLAMPTVDALLNVLNKQGFELALMGNSDVETLSESIRIYKSRKIKSTDITINNLSRKQLKINLTNNYTDIITMRLCKH